MPSDMGLLQGAKRNFMLGLVDDAEEKQGGRHPTLHDPSSYLMRLRPTSDLSKGRNKLNAFMAADTTANLSATSMAHRDVSSIAHVDSHTTSVDHTHNAAPFRGGGGLRPVGRSEIVIGDDASESVKQAEMRAHVAVLRQEVHALTQSLVDACGTNMFADLLDGSPWDATVAGSEEEANPEDRQAALVANGDYLLRQYRIEMDARDARAEAEEREVRLASNLKRLSSLSTIHQGAMERAKEMQRERAAARGEGKENDVPPSLVVARVDKDQPTSTHTVPPRLKLHALEERAYQANIRGPAPTTITTATSTSQPLVPSSDPIHSVVKECVSAIDQIRAQVMLAHIIQAAALHNPRAHQQGMVDRSVGSSNRSNLTPLGDSSMLGGMHTGGVRNLPTGRADDTTHNSDFDLGTRQAISHTTNPVVVGGRADRHHSRNSSRVEPSPPRGRSTSPLSPMTTSILKRNSSSSTSHHQKSTTSSSSPHSSSNRMANRKVVMVGDDSTHHSDSMMVGNNSTAINQGGNNAPRMQRSDMFSDSSVVMLDNSVRSRQSSSAAAGSRMDHSVAASTLDTEDRYKAYGSGGPVVAGDGDADESDGSGSDLDPNVKSSSSSSRPVVRRTGGWGLDDGVTQERQPEARRAPSNTSAGSSTVYGDEVQDISGMSSNTSSQRPQRERQAPSRRNPAPTSQPRAPRKSWSLFGCMGGSSKKGNSSQVAD